MKSLFLGIALVALSLIGITFAGIHVGPITSTLGHHLAESIAAAKTSGIAQ